MDINIRIDPDSPETPHRQIAHWIRTSIADGKIPAGGRIPTQKQFRDATGCAATTTRRAVALLALDGTVYTVPGRGVYARRAE